MSAVEKWLLHLSTWAAAGTGLVFLFMKHVLKSEDPFSVVSHPWQPRVLAAHVVLTPLLIFALGLIARDHILDQIFEPRQRRGRATGLVILALAAPMIVSGYLMQVLTGPSARRVLVGVHVVSGALYSLLFAGHLIASRLVRNGAKGNGGSASRARARRTTLLDCSGHRGIGSMARSQAQAGPAGPEGMKP